MPINWKLMIETGMEGHHVIPLHGRTLEKAFGKGFKRRCFTNDRFGRHGRNCAGRRTLLDPDSMRPAEQAFQHITLTNHLHPGSYLT